LKYQRAGNPVCESSHVDPGLRELVRLPIDKNGGYTVQERCSLLAGAASSDWLEHQLDTLGVAGSSPVPPNSITDVTEN
jgi:hypothetical protein